MKYNKQYFKKLNYSGYLFRRDSYLKLAEELCELLNKLSLINQTSTIMDYGCGVGFLLEGFRELGYKSIYGYDISEWASEQAKRKGLKMLKNINRKFFNIIICLDVLEHMRDRDISTVFGNYKSDILIVRIPCSLDGKHFALEVSNKDPTHINCKKKEGWVTLLHQIGYATILPLSLFTIYDTPGVMCALCLKA